MKLTSIKTLGELKAQNYVPKSIKEELKSNLIQSYKDGVEVFRPIMGYENTVIPQVENAILAKHNINFLGLRGQAKTKIARLLIGLLDSHIPVVKGSEINDDPFAPISPYAKKLVAEMGDETPIEWLAAEDRYYEKLATPDVSVADLIGDVDPIKAANLKLSYADEGVIHFGMIPRANRCLFVINEIPDLQARIQVSLFNILQEGDIQIRGFKLKLPLDISFIFTANPEDYTNRGSIVTPLKDRIGSQILTHYPRSIEIAKQITTQEAKIDPAIEEQIYIPEIARDLIEEISFCARESEYVDANSGVSARLSISAFESLVASIQRRMLYNEEQQTTVRLSDFSNIIQAITGKVELVYEGEQLGADEVAMSLIDQAIKNTFESLFPKIEKLEKKEESSPYDELFTWFFEHDAVDFSTDADNEIYKETLDKITPLNQILVEHLNSSEKDSYFYKELIIWGLVVSKKLSRTDLETGQRINDLYGGYLNGL